MNHSLKPLLSPPGQDILDGVSDALDAVHSLFPVPSSHRKELPYAVRDLSRILTEDRSEMSRPYWASPNLFSAYLHFFLPWNLYRLSWLLPGLDLSLDKDAHILDLGSGPLTFPLALWCARPELRQRPLHFTCCDLSIQAMERGLAILKTLAGERFAWNFKLVRGPLEKALHRPGGKGYDCIAAANVLNELANERTRAGAAPLEQRLANMTNKALACLAPQGRLLLVEPGTRLGGKVISLARAAAIDAGASPLAPCTHAGVCPMLTRQEDDAPSRTYSRMHSRTLSPSYSGWCHFIHPVKSAPQALTDLGEAARLHKDSFAVSCLLLRAPEHSPIPEGSSGGGYLPGPGKDDIDELEALFAEIMEDDDATNDSGYGYEPYPSGHDEGPHPAPRPALRSADTSLTGPLHVRVVSSPIRLPDHEEAARYSCCGKGLALLLNAAKIPPGALVLADTVEQVARANQAGASDHSAQKRGLPARDRKSGAILLRQVPRGGEKKKTAVSKTRRDAPVRRSDAPARPPRKKRDS